MKRLKIEKCKANETAIAQYEKQRPTDRVNFVQTKTEKMKERRKKYEMEN